jgi:hypothetical protein
MMHLVQVRCQPGRSLIPTTSNMSAVPVPHLPASRSNLNTLSLCDKVATSNSWGGLNDACRAACQVPCQAEYELCDAGSKICRGGCKFFGGCDRCPDCAGARDSCLNACQGTCHYNLYANLGVHEVDGLAAGTVTTLTPNLAAKSVAATLTIPGLVARVYADISGLPNIDHDAGVSPVEAAASFSYSCPSPGELTLHLDQLVLSAVDADGIFAFFHSLAGTIPFGLGDNFNNWLNDVQQLVTRESSTLLLLALFVL